MFTFDITRRRAQLHPDRQALYEVGTGRGLTYRELDDRASRLAQAFTQVLGRKPGERVAILCRHSLEFYEALFACQKSGMVLVPLNWRLAVDELTWVLEDCTPDLFIYDPCFDAAAVELLQRFPNMRGLPLAAGREVPGSYEGALAAAPREGPHLTERPMSDLWYVIYTSGTTGRPKGVLQTFGMVHFNYLNIGQPSGLSFQDTSLNVLPHFHVGGINLYTLPSLIAGGTACIQPTFDAGEALRILEDRATVFFGVPAIYQALRAHPTYRPTELGGVRLWASGGAALPTSLLEAYAEDGIVIQQGFGMSETGPTVFLIDRQNALRKAGSVGQPQLYVDVRIADRAGRDMPPGTKGELLIRGPGVTPGYWGRPDLTQDAFTADGWLHSGDVALADDDGYYYIVDRWKDMFISGGENVYPAEIENVLHQHPAVAEAAVIGVADARWGEVGRAVVALRTGMDASEEDLLAFCGERLARYKVPRSVVFVPALPRNAGGKVVKGELRHAHGE